MSTKIVVCGEKEVCIDCLDYLYASKDVDVAMVIGSERDWQADVSGWALEREIPSDTRNINSLYEQIAEVQPDFLFSIQYRYRLRQRILDLPRCGAINLHFGLLPRYAGCYPAAWPILNGELEAGVTLHKMVEAFDEGDILAQQTVAIDSNMTARNLFDALSTTAASLFSTTFPQLQKSNLTGSPQVLEDRLYYSADSINFEKDNFIDWTQNAELIDRKVRAFTFPPFQFAQTTIQWPHGEKKVFVGDTQSQVDSTNRTPGSTIDLTELGYLRVATGEGILRIGRIDNVCSEDFIRTLSCQLHDISFQM